MAKNLTIMPDRARHRLWAELAGDSALKSLRYDTLGWVPWKKERVQTRTGRHALGVLLKGGGTFLEDGADTPQPVRAPGFFVMSPGMRHDYGPVGGGRWEECYWVLDGARIEEWKQGGWWPAAAHFQSLTQTEAEELWRLFEASRRALEQRDREALDRAKLELERWLAARAALQGRTRDPLREVVEKWRRAPEQPWSAPASAKEAGMGYTQFRARFMRDFGTSPYDYLLKLRLELAARWLEATNEPVKAIAARCGFGGPESFIRAFRRAHGTSPGRWRLRIEPAETA